MDLHVEKVEMKVLKRSIRMTLQLPPFRSERHMAVLQFNPATDVLGKYCDAFEKSLLDWVGKEEDAVAYCKEAKKQVQDLLTMIVTAAIQTHS